MATEHESGFLEGFVVYDKSKLLEEILQHKDCNEDFFNGWCFKARDSSCWSVVRTRLGLGQE